MVVNRPVVRSGAVTRISAGARAAVRARETISAVARIVDPSPLIEQRLSEVAAKYEPRLVQLQVSIASESERAARRGLKRSLRQTKREYRRTRHQVESLRIACW